MRIGIVGYGYVGKGMKKLFPNVTDIYDEPLGLGTKDQINQCDLAIICVPTPMKESSEEFKECDTSIVEEVISWIKTPLILIKSTIPPGTTKRLIDKYNKNICFSPEYMGESKYQITDWKYMSATNPRTHDFVIIGGDDKTADKICNIFVEELGPEKTYYLCNSTEAEMVKYLENSFFALKVAYFNEVYDLCEKLGISYHKVREGWALDNRVSKMHTSVFVTKRKFGGKCYPKDCNALVSFADTQGIDLSILKAALRQNG